jgi:hypothetical protein
VSFYSRAANLTDTAADATQALTVQVDAAADARFCAVTVTLASSTGTVTETWRNVPPQVDALASVLTGAAAAPYFAGFAGPAIGTLTSLPFPGGLKASVAAGAVLTVEGQTLRVQADGAAGATTVAVEPNMVTGSNRRRGRSTSASPTAFTRSAGGMVPIRTWQPPCRSRRAMSCPACGCTWPA